MITERLTLFMENVLAVYENAGAKPTCIYDADWLSPCQMSEPDSDGVIEWRPVLRRPHGDLTALANGLEVDIHPDLSEYFGRYWSEHIDAEYKGSPLQLLFTWNVDDYRRLMENQIGHAMAKKRAKQSLTFFFALIDDERFLSLENSTGNILLETIGKKHSQHIADSLYDFFEELVPVVAQ